MARIISVSDAAAILHALQQSMISNTAALPSALASLMLMWITSAPVPVPSWCERFLRSARTRFTAGKPWPVSLLLQPAYVESNQVCRRGSVLHV